MPTARLTGQQLTTCADGSKVDKAGVCIPIVCFTQSTTGEDTVTLDVPLFTEQCVRAIIKKPATGTVSFQDVGKLAQWYYDNVSKSFSWQYKDYDSVIGIHESFLSVLNLSGFNIDRDPISKLPDDRFQYTQAGDLVKQLGAFVGMLGKVVSFALTPSKWLAVIGLLLGAYLILNGARGLLDSTKPPVLLPGPVRK